MTDHAAEQEMELEALEAILMAEMTEIEGPSPTGWPDSIKCYRVAIRSDEEIQQGSFEKKVDLIFAHTPTYPDEAPLYKLSNIQGLSSNELETVDELLRVQVEENLGMAMIYTLVSALKEWLVDQMATTSGTGFEIDAAEIARKEKEAAEQRLAEIRAHGTPVSVETFAAWKRKFDAERLLQKAQLEPNSVNVDKGPTGKRFFMTQEAAGTKVEDAEEGEDALDSTDFDDEDFDDEDESDEDEVLDTLLAQKGQ